MVERTLKEGDSALFADVEEALLTSIATARKGAGWSLCERSVVVVERVLLRFDQVIGEVPKYRYMDAVEHTRRSVTSTKLPRCPVVDSLLRRTKARRFQIRQALLMRPAERFRYVMLSGVFLTFRSPGLLAGGSRMKCCRTAVLVVIVACAFGGCTLIGCGGTATNGAAFGGCHAHTSF